MMSVVLLRLNEKEEKVLKEFARFENVGLSTYIKKVLFEKLEEEYELKLFDSLWNEHIESRSEEHTSELQSRQYLVCRLLLEKKKPAQHHSRLVTHYALQLRPSRDTIPPESLVLQTGSDLDHLVCDDSARSGKVTFS